MQVLLAGAWCTAGDGTFAGSLVPGLRLGAAAQDMLVFSGFLIETLSGGFH